MEDDTRKSGLSRRDFMHLTAGLITAPLVLPGLVHAGTDSAGSRKSSGAPGTGKPNVLFVFTDQERYMRQLPKGYALPAHERLMQEGVTFHNHYCPAVMCTSSRAVILTGLQTADNRMFENVDMPYVKSLSPEVPTIGHMLRQSGYYTAYKGKWHLNKEFETPTPSKLFAQEMEAYGFSDFIWPGDVLTHTLGGYKHDHMIAGSAIAWLRDQGTTLNAEGKPWAMFVSMVNPHDIMYFNTDLPGESVQDTGKLMMHAARAPEHPLYRKRWHTPLPATRNQAIDAPGRPGAHREFNRSWGFTLGNIPAEDARWERFEDFYLNSLLSVDQQLMKMLDELESLGLDQNTIVIFTSDHGEMGGAHGLRGKGPFAYEEAIHLPLIVKHPDVKGGQQCQALTGHIDLVPTILSMCGVDSGKQADVAKRDLPGKDFSAALNQPGSAGLHAVRDSVLFTYSGLATNDSDLIQIISEARAAGKNPKEAVQAAGYRPNLKKRGSLRTVFDGRYKFTRYFSPVDRNRPKNLDELYRWNDVELFDLQTDPAEMTNLAATKGSNAELVARMSDKLEAAIKAEIGIDDGREMPRMEGITWEIDRIDL